MKAGKNTFLFKKKEVYRLKAIAYRQVRLQKQNDCINNHIRIVFICLWCLTVLGISWVTYY